MNYHLYPRIYVVVCFFTYHQLTTNLKDIRNPFQFTYKNWLKNTNFSIFLLVFLTLLRSLP